MKSKIFIVIFLTLASISCTKEKKITELSIGNEISPLKEMVSEINNKANGYDLYASNTRWKWWETAGFDAIGACEGASTGSIAGPWGTICGGICYGVFASCMASNVIVSPTNPTIGDGSTFYLPSTSLVLKNAGIYHNRILNYYNLHQHDFVDNMGNPDGDLIKAYCIEESVYNLNGTSSDSTLMESVFSSLGYTLDYSDPVDYFASLTDTSIGTLGTAFWQDAIELEADDIISLKNDFITITNNSSHLSQTQKNILSVYANVTAYSLYYHQANN